MQRPGFDLCALTGAVVVDPDGAYDPRIVNDRLLLGHVYGPDGTVMIGAEPVSTLVVTVPVPLIRFFNV